MTEGIFEKKVEREPVLDAESNLSFRTLLIFLLAVSSGLLAAAFVLPRWLPGIAGSFTGDSPKAYWYLSRATGFVGLGILWISMLLGIGITNKMARFWPGIPPAYAIHEYASLLGLCLAGFHALILLGDKYSHYTVLQLLIPLKSVQYRPYWVGLGQLCIYAWLIIALTFYIRKLIGKKTWRVIHYMSFACYLGALVHGLMSGTDVNLAWAQIFYWITSATLLFLLVYRILASRNQSRPVTASESPIRR